MCCQNDGDCPKGCEYCSHSSNGYGMCKGCRAKAITNEETDSCQQP